MSATNDSTVYHLEMCSREALKPSVKIDGLTITTVHPPDPERSRHWYCSVGAQWQWVDRLEWQIHHWQQHVDRDEIRTYIGHLNGKQIGYCELEIQTHGQVEIVYFGLLPEFIGKRLGGSLLTAFILAAWELPGTERVWLHTCTHDHQHALANYYARGFELFKTEQEQL